jgi:TatD DNase family protein
MRLIDTHCHIHEWEQAEADAAVVRARDAGADALLVLGVNAADSRLAVRFAERHDGVVAAAGVHPHDAKDATSRNLDELRELAAHPRVGLIGEIGLDYYRNLSPPDQQMRVLRTHLEMAIETGKPVAVHGRDAHNDLLPLLEEHAQGWTAPGGRPAGVLHYFSEDAALAMRYIEMGYVISVHTSVTYPKAAQLQEVARTIPLDRMVLETDSPYGAPQRYRGKRNEPAYVVEAAEKVAELRGIGIDDVARATTRTARWLLGLDVAAQAAGGAAA